MYINWFGFCRCWHLFDLSYRYLYNPMFRLVLWLLTISYECVCVLCIAMYNTYKIISDGRAQHQQKKNKIFVFRLDSFEALPSSDSTQK